jgi:hypothetical protein
LAEAVSERTAVVIEQVGPCESHDDETHALDPEVDGWRCPYEGGTWNYGHFGAVG